MLCKEVRDKVSDAICGLSQYYKINYIVNWGGSIGTYSVPPPGSHVLAVVELDEKDNKITITF